MKVIVNDIKFKVIADSDNEFLVSTKDVAHVFAVSEQNIRNHKMGGELREGVHFIGVTNSNTDGGSLKTMWTKKGIVRLGFLLRRTLYTIAFRDWAEEFIISGGSVKQLTDDEFMEKALQIATARVAEQKKQLEVQAPLVEFAELVVEDVDSLSVGAYCKVINETHGLRIKVTELFDYFREVSCHLMIGRDDAERNKPYAESIYSGLFEYKHVKTVPVKGKIYQSLVTGKGQVQLLDNILDHFSA